MKQTKVNKLIIMLIVFVMMFSNFGYTISAIATSDGFEVITNGFFEKEEVSFEAYFEEDGKELDEKISDVNKTMKLKMKVTPEVDGYLKNATIKAVSESGDAPNFRITDIQAYSTDLELKPDSGFNTLMNLGEEDEVENTEEQEFVSNEVQTSNTEEDEKNEVVEASEIEEKNMELNVSKTVNVSGVNTVSEETALEEIKNEVEDSSAEEQAGDEEEEATNTISETETEDTTNTASNTVTENEANTISNEVADNTVEENAAENTVENTVAEIPSSAEEEEVLIDEEKVIEEKSAEAEDATVDFTSDVQIVSDNEVSITNVIEETVYVLEIEYVQGETLKVEDLYKGVHLQLSGTFINSDLEKVQIAKEDTVFIGWEYDKDITLNSEYTKFSPFKIGEKVGTIVENKITITRDVQEEKYLPIKTTSLEINVPKFNGKLPIEVSVAASKLLATTGEDIGQVTFNDTNWKYENEKITIIVNNEKDGITQNTNGEDEYTVIYRFEDYTEEITSKLNRNINVTVEQYSGKENKIIKKEIKDNQEIDVNVGELVTYSIDSTEEKIQKSRIYANYNSAEALYETEYTSHVAVNILTSDMLERLKIDCSKEIYKDVNGYEFKAEGITYKNIKFNYSDVKHILEKGGNIEIYNQNGGLLYTLDNNLIQKEEDCSININNANGIYIYVNNIAVNGTINFEVTKVIKKCNYDKAAFKNFTEIESRITAEVKYSNIDQTLTLGEIKTTKAFNESYTRANLYMNKENLSTIQENENVELRVELNNDKEDSDLYINPNFEFVFPKYVKEVHVESMNLLYENGLRIADFETYTESDIVKMRVELTGTQTIFSENTVTNGTNILINIRMKLDEYTPSKEDQIKLYYCNEGVSNYESQTKWTISKQIPNGILKTTNGFDVALFNYQAPNGLVAINGIRNYDGDLSEIKSVRQGETMKQIPMNDSSRIATMDLLTLNNTGNECSDLVMIGRIPFKGNKDVVSGKDLGTTTTGIMKDFIKEDVQNGNMATIYYSENPNATKSIEDGANGWRIASGVIDLSAVRSYMIVVKGNVKPGAVLKYYYDFEIPGNLPYEVSMAGSFGAYYNNNTDVAVVYESTVADKVGVKTELGPKVEATLSIDVGDGTEVGECRFLNYTLKVKNTGSVTAENITVTNPVPEYTALYEYTENLGYGNNNYISSNKRKLEWKIDKLEPEEEKTYNYMLKSSQRPNIEEYYSKDEIKQDEQGYYYEETDEEGNISKKYVDENFEIFIENKASVEVGNLAIEKESNTIKNKIVDSNFDIEIVADCNKETKVGSEISYNIKSQNISKKVLNNSIVEISIPDNLKYEETIVNLANHGLKYDEYGIPYNEPFDQDKIVYNEELSKITINIDEIYIDEALNITVKAKANKGSLESKEAIAKFITEDGKAEESSKVNILFKGPKLEVKQDTNVVEDFILEGEELEFLVVIENTGNGDAENVNIQSNISEYLTNVSASITGDVKDGVNVSKNKIDKTIFALKSNGKMVLKIKGTAKDLDITESQKNITNKVGVIADYHEMVETNEVNIIIKQNPDREEKQEDTTDKEENVTDSKEEKPSDNSNESGNDNPNTNTNDTNKNDTVEKDTIPETPTQEPNKNEENKPIENNATQSEKKEETYSISGTAWLDNNKNGGKDEGEEKIPSVKVQLMKSGTMIKATTTDGNGEYVFSGLSNGKYTVKYIYDGEKYTTTTYKNIKFDESLNSKAVESEIGIAVSNNIEISNANVSNIHIGLMKKEFFNLTVDKYITKATVKTNKREETYNFDNLQLGKIEIKARELRDAIVTLEYLIVIENEGEIAGNATKIVDYIPKEMALDASRNEGWYLGEDGNAYNESLKETVIQPGEKKEISIILTKKMTEDNTGVASNKVTILATENQSGATEIQEDNTNTQEMMILISTGKEIRNITIISFLIIVMISLGISLKSNDIAGKIKNIKIKKIYR